MKGLSALAGGLTGATVLTIIHETVRRFDPDAPRMDLLGMQTIAKLMRHMGTDPPHRRKLYQLTLVGDIAGNALYYSLAALGRRKGIFTRGILLGLGAGVGAVFLPKPLHLNEEYSSRTPQTKLMTMGLYLVGGLVASVAIQFLEGNRKKRKFPRRLLNM